MTVKTLSASLFAGALLAALPAMAMADDVQYGYQKSSNTSTDDMGNVSTTTVEQSWASKASSTEPVTDVNAPADAQPASTSSMQPQGGDEAQGQHPAGWYQNNLQPNGRYVFDAESGKLIPVVEKSEIEELNKKAAAKAK